MNRTQFDKFCSKLPATTNVIQWGDSSVWKVGGKIFAISSIWGEGKGEKISFKCSDMAFRMLCEEEDIIPAPYLARAKWVQLQDPKAMSAKDLKAYIKEAHRIIAATLTKAKQREFGLENL